MDLSLLRGSKGDFREKSPAVKECTCATHQQQQQAGWSRVEHKKESPRAPGSLLYKNYTSCYRILTSLHCATISACVFICAKSWLHSCVSLCTYTDKLGHVLRCP